MIEYRSQLIQKFLPRHIKDKNDYILDKNNCSIYKDSSLLVLHNVNGQKIDHIRKKVIQLFKDSGFVIDIENNLKIFNFLDTTFNLNNGIFKPYKKPNDSLLYLKKTSNHPPQIIKQLPKIISDRLSKIPLMKFLRMH